MPPPQQKKMSRLALIRATKSGSMDDFNQAWWDMFPEPTDKLGYASMIDAFLAASFANVDDERWDNACVKINECGVAFGLSEEDADHITLAGSMGRRMPSASKEERVELWTEIVNHLAEAGYTTNECKVLARAESYFKAGLPLKESLPVNE